MEKKTGGRGTAGFGSPTMNLSVVKMKICPCGKRHNEFGPLCAECRKKDLKALRLL